MPTIEVRPDTEEHLQQIADALLKSRKVVVITGAGISTNSGIPDFRSENGLYSLIQAQFDAASKLNALESGDVEDLPASDSEPPPTKRRRLSHDTEPILPSVAVATTTPYDAADTTSEPQYLQNGLPAAGEPPFTPDERPLEELPAPEDSLTKSSTAMTVPVNPLRPQMLGEPIAGNRSSRLTVSSSPLRQALHASTFASRSGLDLPAVPEDESDPAQDLPQDGTTTEPVPCSACALRQSRRRRAASMPPVSLSTTNDEMASPPLRRARSASPPGGGCHCQASPTRRPLQHPKDDRYSKPRRRGVLDVNSPTLSLPPMSSAGVSSARSKASSRFRRGHRGINSSPLSSPPPFLFDPYQESSSSTSQQGSSEAGSTASSESGETPPSSMPSLTSQTSNPSRTSLPNLKGRDLFDVSIWSDPVRTSVFYTFASTLRQKSRDSEPTASHHFISHLRDRGKLVRCYTQNIDQIEEKVGLSTSLQQGPGSRGRFSRKSTGGSTTNTSDTADGKDTATVNSGGVECVFLHGSLQSLRCFLCGQVCEWDAEGRHLETLSGRQPECPHCAGATAARQERGKRALGVGKLRPDIVLYGEEHPNAHLIDPLVKHDLALYPDFMLILGTSLKVHGLKVIVREFARAVHSKGGKVVFVNFTKAPESAWGDIIDYWIRWDCDAWVANLRERIPLLWLPPGTKPPKRKRESSSLEKASKKRSLVKQSSSIVVQTPASETTVTEDAITVLGPLPSASLGDPTSLDVGTRAAVAAPLGDVVATGDAAMAGNAPPPDVSRVELATTDVSPTAPGLSQPRDAPSGDASATVQLPTVADQPATEVPTVNQPSSTATASEVAAAPAARAPKTPKAPVRPMALREDTCSAAYLAWQVSRDLRRLSGNTAELSTFSSPIVRPKVIRTPRSSAKTTPQSSSSTEAVALVPSTSPCDVSPSLRPPRVAPSQALVPEEAVVEAPVLEERHPQGASQEGGTTQEEAVLEDTNPTDVVQHETILETVSQDDATEEAMRHDTSEETTETDTIFEQVVLENRTPEASMPAQDVSPSPSPLSSALSSPAPASPLALATDLPSAPSPPTTTHVRPFKKQQRKSLPGKNKISALPPRRSLRKSLPLPAQSSSSTEGKTKKKPRQAKGWVDIVEDGPEDQEMKMRQAMHWGGVDKNGRPPPPPPTDAQADDDKKKKKPRQAKGWVDIVEDGPEDQEMKMRQAMHWGVGLDSLADEGTSTPTLPDESSQPTPKLPEENAQPTPTLPPISPPPPLPATATPDESINTAPPTKGKQKRRRERGKGWSLCPDDAPEAQELQMRQASHSGVGLVRSADESHSIYDALKANPRHRKRRMIDGAEVALTGGGRTSRRSLPAPNLPVPALTPADMLPLNGHATAVFRPLPDLNEMLPMPVAQESIPMPKPTGPDKENHSIPPPQTVSDIKHASIHDPTLAPIQSRPPPLSIQFDIDLPHAKLQPIEPISPPPGPPAVMAPTVGIPEQGQELGDMAFTINDSLLFHFRAPPRIWTPEDQLREEAAALALSSLKTGLR